MDNNKNIFVFIVFLFLLLSSQNNFQKDIEAETVKKNQRIEKSLFFQDQSLGTIRTIQQGNFDNIPGADIAVLGQRGGCILDLAGRLKKDFQFEKGIGELSPFLVEHNGDDFSIMVGQENGGVLLDSEGGIKWTYKFGNGETVRDFHWTADDLNRDGVLEFYGGGGYGDSFVQLNDSGNVLWKKNVRIDDIAIYDPGQEGVSLIVTSSSLKDFEFYFFKSKLYDFRFWDYQGNLVREFKIKKQGNDFEVIRWPENYNILAHDDYNIYSFDFQGNVNFNFYIFPPKKLPYSIRDIKGIPVQLDSHTNSYLAVLAESRATLFRAMLLIFFPNGKLFYREELGFTAGLCALKSDTLENEFLLTGDGSGNVWRYQLSP